MATSRSSEGTLPDAAPDRVRHVARQLLASMLGGWAVRPLHWAPLSQWAGAQWYIDPRDNQVWLHDAQVGGGYPMTPEQFVGVIDQADRRPDLGPVVGWLEVTPWWMVAHEHWVAAYRGHLRSPEWATIKRLARERDGWRCQGCTSAKDLNTHHLTYDRLGGERLGDVQILCDACHGRVHCAHEGATQTGGRRPWK